MTISEPFAFIVQWSSISNLYFTILILKQLITKSNKRLGDVIWFLLFFCYIETKYLKVSETVSHQNFPFITKHYEIILLVRNIIILILIFLWAARVLVFLQQNSKNQITSPKCLFYWSVNLFLNGSFDFCTSEEHQVTELFFLNLLGDILRVKRVQSHFSVKARTRFYLQLLKKKFIT